MIISVSSNDGVNWAGKTEADKKINEIANIIRTRKGDIAFNRNVGIDAEFIDTPMTQIQPIIVNEITDAIMNNVTGVNIISVDLINGDPAGDFDIKVVAQI